MSTKSTMEIINRPNFYVHIYEEMDGVIWADISSGQFHLSIVLSLDRDAYADGLKAIDKFWANTKPVESKHRTPAPKTSNKETKQ